jgi:hypothetical protein
MNKHITELAEHAGVQLFEDKSFGWSVLAGTDDNLQKFAELIITKCAEIADIEKPNSIGCGYITKTKGMLIKEHFGICNEV